MDHRNDSPLIPTVREHAARIRQLEEEMAVFQKRFAELDMNLYGDDSAVPAESSYTTKSAY